LITACITNKWRACEHAITPVEVLNGKKIDSKPSRLFWRRVTDNFPRPKIKAPVMRPSVVKIAPKPVLGFRDATFDDALKRVEASPKKKERAVSPDKKGAAAKGAETATSKAASSRTSAAAERRKANAAGGEAPADQGNEAKWKAGQDLKNQAAK